MKKLSLNVLTLITCAPVFLLQVLVLLPLHVFLYSDRVIRETPLDDLLDLAIMLLDIFVFAAVAAFIIHAALTLTRRSAWRILLVYSACVVGRRALTLITVWDIDAFDVFAQIFYSALEIGEIALIAAFVTSSAAKYLETRKTKQRAAARLGDSLKEDIEFSGIFSKKNPYDRCAVIAGVIIGGGSIFSRVIFDIFAGAPTSSIEVLSMVIGYLSDVLRLAVAYFFCRIICLSLYRRSEKQ